MRHFGERQRFLLGENFENGFQRAVAARAMKAQLVAGGARFREPAIRREQTGERAHRIADALRIDHVAERFSNRVRVADTAVRQRMHRARERVGAEVIAQHRLAAVDRQHQIFDFGGGERRHVNHFKSRRRLAQQPMGPGHVPGGENEPVSAGGQRLHQLADRRAKARKAFKCAKFQHFVEQEGGRPPAVSGA